MKTEIVEILKGHFKGQSAYVTYKEPESNYLRCTPVYGDPLLSLEFKYSGVRFNEEHNERDQ